MPCHREFRRQIFGPLPRPPLRRLLGSGAFAVGPIRAIVICGGLAVLPGNTAGPEKTTRFPPSSPPPAAVQDYRLGEPASVPTPGSAALLAVALAGLWIVRKR